jgi:hypothetical protein
MRTVMEAVARAAGIRTRLSREWKTNTVKGYEVTTYKEDGGSFGYEAEPPPEKDAGPTFAGRGFPTREEALSDARGKVSEHLRARPRDEEIDRYYTMERGRRRRRRR